MPVEALAIINPDEDEPRTGLVAAGIVTAVLYAYYKATVSPGVPIKNYFSLVSKTLAGMVVGYYGFEYLTKERLEQNADRYFVKVVGERVVYPREGSKYFPRGYSLRKAQDFARIGSQTGKPRKVLRGGPQGKRVRTYREGRRAWPVTAAQAKTLKPAERPRQYK